MNKKISLLFFALTVVVSLKAQPSKYVKSTIKEVTVYLQGAEVTGTATTNLEAGQNEIIFEGLSNYIDPQSIQILSNTGNITILSAVYQQNYLRTKDKDPNYLLLRDSLDIYTFELSKILNQKAAYQEELSMILSNKKVGGDNTGLNVIELQKAADFFRTRIASVKNEITLLEIKERKLSVIIARYQNQINVIEQNQNLPSGELLVKVAAGAATTANFSLSYLVTQAGWSPLYDIRVKDVNTPAKLMYKAEVYQMSGVDWKNVRLTLSTGNPSVGGTQPMLYPWYLSFNQPVYNYEKNKGRAMPQAAPSRQAEVMSLDEDAGGYMPPPVMVSENQLNVEFKIDVPYDIPTGGKRNLVAMKEYDVKSTYKYFAVPKIDKDAFLLAKITDWSTLQLLPGNANIFFEGAYVGQTFIDPNAVNDTLNVSLGRDKKIIIKRDKIRDYESQKLIGTQKKETSAFDYSLRNTKNIPIEIEILDQLPISQNSDIEVKAEELSGAVVNDATGEVKWSFNVAPNETKKWKFIYSVKYPKDKRVSGL